MYWPKQFTDFAFEQDAQLSEIQALFNSGYYQQALDASLTYLDEHPDAVMPHVIRSLIFIRRRRFEDAQTEMNHALAKRQDSSTTYALAGIATREQHDYRQAAEYLQKAVNLAQSTQEKSSYLFHLAYTNLPMKKYDQASSNLWSAFHIYPTFVSGWALVMLYLWRYKIASILLFGVGTYAAFGLPIAYALTPVLLLAIFLLLTSLFDIKVKRPDRAIIGIIWSAALLAILYVRIL